MTASSGMCNWATVYAFVDSLGALRAPLLASIAAGRADLNALERFDYWLQQFVYMRGIGACWSRVVRVRRAWTCGDPRDIVPALTLAARMECDWAAYNAVIASIQAIKNRAQQMAAAFAQGIPARISLVQNVSTMMYDLIATVRTTALCAVSSLARPRLVSGLNDGGLRYGLQRPHAVHGQLCGPGADGSAHAACRAGAARRRPPA